MTDSGGLQEEACILKIPCLTLRDNTERPETIKAEVNILAGTQPQEILSCAQQMMQDDKKWINPFGDGQTAVRILNSLNYKLC